MEFNLINIVYLIIVLLASMILHELGHGYTSYVLGDDTAKLQGRLTFNPLKHLDPFLSILLPVSLALTGGPIFGGAKPVPYNPNNLRYGDLGLFLVAFSGPLVNLLLAMISYGVIGVFSIHEGTISDILELSLMINIGFFVFNILPIPPLDGSRVIYSVAPDFIRNILEKLERYSLFILLGLLILFNSQISVLMSYLSGLLLSLFRAIFSF
jgi:Zn-dependent protease